MSADAFHFAPAPAAILIAAPFVGSFLGTLAIRLPAGEPVVAARSRCPACAHALDARDLVPLASWLIGGGRCRHCASPVSGFYPAMEIAALLAALWAVLAVDGRPPWLACLLGWALLALAAADLREMILPDALTLPLIASGIAIACLAEPAAMVDSAIGAAVGFLLLYGINGAYRLLRARDGLGLGDAKLLAAAGAWLGWRGLPITLLIATLAALTGVLAMRLAGRRLAAEDAVPFGAFLCFAFWVAWLHGPRLGIAPIW